MWTKLDMRILERLALNKTKTARTKKKKRKNLGMSHVVLETRRLFPLERYVWLILMSYIFKMTYVNNLEKKKGNCLWSGSCTQYNCFVSKFFFSLSLLSFWVFIFIMQQVIILVWSVGTISWRFWQNDFERSDFLTKDLFITYGAVKNHEPMFKRHFF